MKENDELSHLSQMEKNFFSSVKDGKLDDVKQLISQMKIDLEEKDGMTALMHASYKGNPEMVDFLLSQGANVNANTHKDSYTPLMFAALSGSSDCVRLLLEAGADSEAVNKINRTASQLGAFTGRHDCVSVINNFIKFEEVDYFTRQHGIEREPLLKCHLARPLHKYIVIPNLNPVKLVLFLKENSTLLDEKKEVDRVLLTFCERSFKNVNEVLSVKTHILNHLYNTTIKWKEGKEGKDGLDGLLRYLIKGRSNDGFQLGTETVLRDSLKSFPYSASNILQTLIKTLATVQMGNSPSALIAITQSINGLQSANFSECCNCCGDRHCPNKCSNCKMVRYCNQTCQKLHWSTHKKFCNKLKEEYQERENDERETQTIKQKNDMQTINKSTTDKSITIDELVKNS